MHNKKYCPSPELESVLSNLSGFFFINDCPDNQLHQTFSYISLLYVLTENHSSVIFLLLYQHLLGRTFVCYTEVIEELLSILSCRGQRSRSSDLWNCLNSFRYILWIGRECVRCWVMSYMSKILREISAIEQAICFLTIQLYIVRFMYNQYSKIIKKKLLRYAALILTLNPSV